MLEDVSGGLINESLIRGMKSRDPMPQAFTPNVPQALRGVFWAEQSASLDPDDAWRPEQALTTVYVSPAHDCPARAEGVQFHTRGIQALRGTGSSRFLYLTGRNGDVQRQLNEGEPPPNSEVRGERDLHHDIDMQEESLPWDAPLPPQQSPPTGPPLAPSPPLSPFNISFISQRSPQEGTESEANLSVTAVGIAIASPEVATEERPSECEEGMEGGASDTPGSQVAEGEAGSAAPSATASESAPSAPSDPDSEPSPDSDTTDHRRLRKL
jgi:hypothetical protein